MAVPNDLARYLHLLHEDHAYQVNVALEEDRDDLARKASDAYVEKVVRILTAPEFAL